MGKQICTPRIYCIVLFLAVGMFLGGTPGRAQTIPPSAPVGLTATATSCGQVDLSWNSATDNSGTGLKAYHTQRWR